MKNRLPRVLGIAVVAAAALSALASCGDDAESGNKASDAAVGGGGTGGQSAPTCFTPDEAWKQLGSGGSAGADSGGSDAEPSDADLPDAVPSCPETLSLGMCAGYKNLQVVSGKCCYDFWSAGSAC